MPICVGEKVRTEYEARATARDSEQMLKRTGGLEWENQRPRESSAVVGA